MTKLEKQDLQKREVFSNLENTYPYWEENTPYDTKVVVVYKEILYESAKDGNTDAPDISPLSWYPKGPSNKIALYDNYPSTKSTSTQDIVLKYEQLDILSTLIFGSIKGSSIAFVFKKASGEVFLEKEIDLVQYKEPTNYWEYCFLFGQIKTITDWIEQINTIETNLSLEITITPIDGVAEIGFIAVGRLNKIGCTYSALGIDKQPIIDLQRDVDGRIVSFGGDGWKKYDFTLGYKDLDRLYEAMTLFDKNDAELTLFVGDDVGDLLIYSVLGVYRGYNISTKDKSLKFSVYSVDSI